MTIARRPNNQAFRCLVGLLGVSIEPTSYSTLSSGSEGSAVKFTYLHLQSYWLMFLWWF